MAEIGETGNQYTDLFILGLTLTIELTITVNLFIHPYNKSEKVYLNKFVNKYQ